MKLRKIITMGLAAIMAVSAMSISAFAADVETYSEVVHTYKINDNGERELIDVNVDIPIDATEEEKDQIYFSAAYSAVNDIMPFATNAYSQIFTQKDRPIPHSQHSGVNNDSLIGTFTATGTRGFAVKISNPTNLKSYNMSFSNEDTGRNWYDLELPIQQGVNVNFYNGRTSNSTGSTFVYTQNQDYAISISGQKSNIYANADLDLVLYTY